MRAPRLLAGFAAGLGAVLALALLMAPSGGFPSRPRFQAIGVGVAADPTIGSITGADADGLLLRSETGGSLLLDSSGAIFEMQDAAARVSVNRGVLDAAVPILKIGDGSFSGEDLLVGESILVTKEADTSRASTATVAADPDLAVTSLPAGMYRLEAYLRFAAGAGGSASRPDLSGAGNAFLQGTRHCATNTAITQDESFEAECVGAGNWHLHLAGGTTDGAAGDLSIFWAQETSNAAATVLESESYLIVTRIK